MSSGSSCSWWDGWSGTYHGWCDSINTLHKVQDVLQQTTVLSQRRAKKTHTERAVTISRGYAAMEAAPRARAWQEETKRLYVQKFQEAAEAEAVNNEATQCTLEKTEAVENLLKTVKMQTHSPAITEADFFQTLHEREEETQRAVPDPHHTMRNAHRGRMSHAGFAPSVSQK